MGEVCVGSISDSPPLEITDKSGKSVNNKIIVYFISCDGSTSKHLAGFGGAPPSRLRLVGVLDLSTLRDPSAEKKGKGKLTMS